MTRSTFGLPEVMTSSIRMRIPWPPTRPSSPDAPRYWPYPTTEGQSQTRPNPRLTPRAAAQSTKGDSSANMSYCGLCPTASVTQRTRSPAHPNDPQQPLERAELTVERAQGCAPRSPTQITALGNLPSAVIREPVTSGVGHDVLSGIVRPLGLAFLLLEVR